MPRTMVNFGKKSSKITLFLDNFSPKLTVVCPKCVSWRSNQEWPSICADTVCGAYFKRRVIPLCLFVPLGLQPPHSKLPY